MRRFAVLALSVALAAAACSADPRTAAEPSTQAASLEEARVTPRPAAEPTPADAAVPDPVLTPPDEKEPAATPAPNDAGSIVEVAAVPELARAGDVCTLTYSLANGPGATLSYRVPSEMYAIGCVELGYRFGQVGGPEPIAINLEITSALKRGLFHLIGGLPNTGLAISEAEWRPIGDVPAWRLAGTTAAAPTGRETTVVAFDHFGHTRIHAWTDVDVSGDVEQSLDELVSSITIWQDENPYPPPAPQYGGRCVGPTWAFDVPEAWFQFGNCRHLNTSSEAGLYYQCECLAPLSIQLRTDADVVFEPNRERADGLAYFDGQFVEPANEVLPEHEVRRIAVDTGDGILEIRGHPDYEYALVGHTWQDTTDAMDAILASLRLHSHPDCGQKIERVVTTDRATLTDRLGEAVSIPEVPRGTVMLATGCGGLLTDDPDRVEVRATTDHTVVGWLDAAVLERSPATTCRAGDINPVEWQESVEGDFNGDGATDTMWLRGDGRLGRELAPGGVDLEMAEAAIEFAGGGIASGVLSSDELGDLHSATVDAVVRPVGFGGDAVIATDWSKAGAYVGQQAVIGTVDCEIIVLGWLASGASVTNQLDWCAIPTAWGDVLRTWHTTWGASQRFVVESEALLIWDGTGLIDAGAEGTTALSVSPRTCGPTFEPEFAPVEADGSPETRLAGRHGLTLQWIGTEGPDWGEVEFTPVGGNRYLVSGGQDDPETGNFVRLNGVVEQLDDLTLAFDGTISTGVDYIGTCERIETGQTFLSTQGRRYWRMQDFINCDGITADYIDIYFD